MNNQKFLYNNLVRFYYRSKRKLRRLLAEGKNLQKQNIIRRRIERLYKRLAFLQLQLRVGISAVAISGTIILFSPENSDAQTFDTMQVNRFGLTDIGNYSAPAFGDLDDDGDLDMIAGDNHGDFYYFENTGTSSSPQFDTVQMNPFSLTQIGYGYHAMPAFVDLDNDGDLDLMVGARYGDFKYFENTGTPSSPGFAAMVNNPFSLTNIGNNYCAPALADLDNDGDFDLLAGERFGTFYYFENTGTAGSPAFAAKVTNPFSLTDIGLYSTPAFTDMDSDGDLDLLAGDKFGNFHYFENTGTASSPSFDPEISNPFSLTNIGSNYCAPAFADMDGDSDFDLMTGERSGNFNYFERLICTSPSVTSHPADNNVCSGNNASFSITASDATAYQWYEDDGGGFTILSNGGKYSNVTTTSLTITGVTSGMDNYLYKCMASSSCTPNDTSNTATLNVTTSSTYTWTGTVSTNWNTAGNWSSVIVPDECNAVVIPGTGTAPNQPTISIAGAKCKNITIDQTDNGMLTISGSGTLTITD